MKFIQIKLKGDITMNKYINKVINELIILLGIYISICAIWITLEEAILGSAVFSPIDTIIATILTFSLEANLKTWNKKLN